MADCGGENVVMEETMRTETDEIRDNLKYLTLLSRDYPSQAAAASEIISTQALLKLPKGTEHFMSDLHGENEAFVHILNSASGVIREKVDQVLGDTVPKHTRAELAMLLWNTAGRPAPATLPAFADVADPELAQAAQWAIEQGYLKARADGSFKPDKGIAKWRVIRGYRAVTEP